MPEQNYQKKANVKAVKEFDVTKNMDTVIMVSKGGLILRDCVLSLRSMPKNLKQKIPMFVSMPGTRINLVKCDLRGNDHMVTAGCVFLNSDVVMSSCKLTNF